MKTQLPVAIAFLSGFIMVVAFFVPEQHLENFSQNLLTFVTIVGGFTLLLGIVNIMRANVKVVKKREKEWGFKLLLILTLVVMALSSFIWGTQEGTVYHWMFQNMQAPMMSTMFSLLAFFIASAAYRAFRARTREATILLVVSVIVMLGRIPLGQFFWHRLPEITDWIMAFPNLAVQRGIIIGAALGAASMSLRIILGIERTYMGRG
jgi:drug/metabolite transporter (DMT)-like permease